MVSIVSIGTVIKILKDQDPQRLDKRKKPKHINFIWIQQNGAFCDDYLNIVRLKLSKEKDAVANEVVYFWENVSICLDKWPKSNKSEIKYLLRSPAWFISFRNQLASIPNKHNKVMPNCGFKLTK